MRQVRDRFVVLACIAAIPVMISACAGTTQVIQQHPVASACLAMGGTMQTLAGAIQAKKVPAPALASLAPLLASTGAVCTAKSEPTLSAAEYTLFINAVAQLNTLAAQYGTAQ